jgi:chromosome condensin MukBEF ATPase and DNA-binding subunit MukB
MNTIEVTYNEVEQLIATERQLRAQLESVNEDLHHTRCERTCLRQENEWLVEALKTEEATSADWHKIARDNRARIEVLEDKHGDAVRELQAMSLKNAQLVAALRAFVERGNKVSGHPAQYDPWVGELVNARVALALLNNA